MRFSIQAPDLGCRWPLIGRGSRRCRPAGCRLALPVRLSPWPFTAFHRLSPWPFTAFHRLSLGLSLPSTAVPCVFAAFHRRPLRPYPARSLSRPLRAASVHMSVPHLCACLCVCVHARVTARVWPAGAEDMSRVGRGPDMIESQDCAGALTAAIMPTETPLQL